LIACACRAEKPAHDFIATLCFLRLALARLVRTTICSSRSELAVVEESVIACYSSILSRNLGFVVRTRSPPESIVAACEVRRWRDRSEIIISSHFVTSSMEG
jgi:hypothetical protein